VQFRAVFFKGNSMSKALKIRLAAVPAFLAATVGAAHAAVPAVVDTALADLSTDALKVAGVVLAAIVAVYAFKFIRKGL
jgi:hypothetical protein